MAWSCWQAMAIMPQGARKRVTKSTGFTLWIQISFPFTRQSFTISTTTASVSPSPKTTLRARSEWRLRLVVLVAQGALNWGHCSSLSSHCRTSRRGKLLAAHSPVQLELVLANPIGPMNDNGH